MDTRVIREFKESECNLYKQLRLESLLESPDAFGGTYENENQRSDADWLTRFSMGVQSSTDIPLVAFCDRNPVGLAWGRIEVAEMEVANLYQMWISPESRGKGLGLLLLERVREWSVKLGAHQLNLGVTVSNGNAYQLYRSFGFSNFGAPEPLRPGSDLKVQPMSLNVKSA